ncbi:hypothetical protein HGRIS_000498 [Hohenbuehelia grisea]|uniref:Major facilitator superfamily (MFS) profile domain-containing protein n=1 Tax=Hohenbuehelia grisea TaxID=104357 RepID=A0ABR3JS13_9AGAR
MSEVTVNVAPADKATNPVSHSLPPPQSWWLRMRKWLFLALFCLAQFLETFNASAIYVALPSINRALSLSPEEDTWLIAVYTLTFASFMLMCGRICDVYNPKLVFVLGCLLFGVTSLIFGFVRVTIVSLVLRAFTGVAAAMMSPSALHLIILNFTDETQRATAIGFFGATAGIGNVLGLILGAIIVQFTTWQWLFWFSAIASLVVGVVAFITIPNAGSDEEHREKPTDIDFIGVGSLTSALILLIFAITSGSSTSWDSPRFIAPLIIFFLLVAGFVYYEAKIPEHKAVMPPSMWRIPAFAVLMVTALFPFLCFSCIFFFFTSYWQDHYGWGILSAGTHFLPIGVTFLLTMPLASRLPDRMPTRWILVLGNGCISISAAILAFADRPGRYWSYNFPAFLIGTWGVSMTFAGVNIMVFRVTPASMAGTVGAIFTAALQLGTAIGIPVISAIQLAVDAPRASPDFTGRSVAFWVVFGIGITLTILAGVFYPRKLANTQIDASLKPVNIEEAAGAHAPPPDRKEEEKKTVIK